MECVQKQHHTSWRALHITLRSVDSDQKTLNTEVQVSRLTPRRTTLEALESTVQRKERWGRCNHRELPV